MFVLVCRFVYSLVEKYDIAEGYNVDQKQTVVNENAMTIFVNKR